MTDTFRFTNVIPQLLVIDGCLYPQSQGVPSCLESNPRPVLWL